MALNLQHQTLAQFMDRLRLRYLNANGEDAAKIAAFTLDRIDAGDFTDVQARTAFGLTVAQWAVLKNKMATLRTNWLGVRMARGE